MVVGYLKVGNKSFKTKQSLVTAVTVCAGKQLTWCCLEPPNLNRPPCSLLTSTTSTVAVLVHHIKTKTCIAALHDRPGTVVKIFPYYLNNHFYAFSFFVAVVRHCLTDDKGLLRPELCTIFIYFFCYQHIQSKFT